MTAPNSPSRPPALPSAAWILIPSILSGALALYVFFGGHNEDWFIITNAAAQYLLPAALWAGITNFGATLGAFSMLGPVLLWRPRWVASAVLAAPAAILYAQGLKAIFAEPRPAAVLGVDAITVIGLPLRTNSFPSGHTTTAFVIAGVFTFCATAGERRWVGWVALALAALVGFSRLAVGAHWPLDVFAGAAGGWLCAALGTWWADRWRFWEHARGLRFTAVLLFLLAIALAIEDLGYPEGLWSQYLLVACGLLGAGWAWLHPRTAGKAT